MKTVQSQDQSIALLSLLISVVAMGFSVFGAALSNSFQYSQEAKKQISYAQLFVSEIEYNLQQANDVVAQYEKSQKVTGAPVYLRDVYQAGLQSGYLFVFGNDASGKIMNAYAALNQVEHLQNDNSLDANKETVDELKTFIKDMNEITFYIDADWNVAAKHELRSALLGIYMAGVPLAFVAISLAFPILKRLNQRKK